MEGILVPAQGWRESLGKDHLVGFNLPRIASTQTMTTTINKQKIVTQIFTALGKNAKGKPDERPVLEQFLYAILRENTTRDAADDMFENLRKRFFDWNEVRVSSAMELSEAMGDQL